MKFPFGKHRGKSFELLMLKEPDYILWVLSNVKDKPAVTAEIHRLMGKFDSKPVLRQCMGSKCKATASYCTVYQGNVVSPVWWCDNCNPHSKGANAGKLYRIETYHDALEHCSLFCSRKESFKSLIKSIAEAKGLPSRVGEKQAQAFFV